MSHRLPNYLGAHRKRAGLSQKNVAFLLGCRVGANVWRYERFAREPTLRAAMACEAIFHVTVRELFAGVYAEAVKSTERRARQLARRLSEHWRRPVRPEPLGARYSDGHWRKCREVRFIGAIPVAHRITVETPAAGTHTTIEIIEVPFHQGLEDGFFS